MPDGGPSEPKAEVAPRRQRGRWLQTLPVLALVGVGGYFGVDEVRDRFTYVQENDARITADLITVSSRVSGWLTTLAVDAGDLLTREQVIATVDDRESRLLLQQMEAQLAALASERERLAAERVLIDEQTKSRFETARSQLDAARASVGALEPQLELARAELVRADSLFSKRVIAIQQLEQARAAARRIEGEYRQAVAEREESSAKLQEARVERARLNVLDREVDMLSHREDELRGRIEQQRLDVSDRTIRSPVDGVVDRTFVESGEFVRPGQRLAIVHDPTRVWIEANIKETEVRKLAVGQSAQVLIDAYPDDRFEGRIESIGSATTGSFALLPNPNPSGNFTKITQRLPVRIAIEQREGRLRPGMMVELKIDVRGSQR